MLLAGGGGEVVGERPRKVGGTCCGEVFLWCGVGLVLGIKAWRCCLLTGLVCWVGYTCVAAVSGGVFGDLAWWCGQVRRVLVWVLGGLVRVGGSAADGSDNQ